MEIDTILCLAAPIDGDQYDAIPTCRAVVPYNGNCLDGLNKAQLLLRNDANIFVLQRISVMLDVAIL